MMEQSVKQPLLCLRCGEEMYLTLPVPENVRHPLLREANKLVTQSLRITTYQCPRCGKLEFFRRNTPK